MPTKTKASPTSPKADIETDDGLRARAAKLEQKNRILHDELAHIAAGVSAQARGAKVAIERADAV